MRESDLLSIASSHERVYIYGAGMVGSLVLNRLKEYGLDDGRIHFAVSCPQPDQEYLGHRVHGITDAYSEKDSVVIVAVLPKNQRQLISNLRENRIESYVVVDTELYEEMESNYISHYLESHKPTGEKRDILFMSSDNNNTSGAFLCMVDLCKEMKNKGISPLIVLPCYGNAEDTLVENDINYTFVQSTSGLVKIDGSEDAREEYPDAVDNVEELIKNHGIKIVHNNTDHTYVGAEAARRLGIPYIWHVRENIREQGLRFANEEYSYGLINDAETIVSVSEYVSRCYPSLNRNKVRVIYDGVETGKYYRQRSILEDDIIHILMPGIMVPLKGQHQLVDAAIALKESGLRFDVSLVGSGDADYVRKLEDRVKDSGLEDCVFLYGRVNDLEKWYERSDIVVVCSRSEAFGRVTVEAQLSGCVVIGAACGATTELIADGVNGYLYELDNTLMLADKISSVAAHRDEAIMVARRGQTEAYKKYDRSVCCENVIRVYDGILKKD